MQYEFRNYQRGEKTEDLRGIRRAYWSRRELTSEKTRQSRVKQEDKIRAEQKWRCRDRVPEKEGQRGVRRVQQSGQ